MVLVCIMGAVVAFAVVAPNNSTMTPNFERMFIIAPSNPAFEPRWMMFFPTGYTEIRSDYPGSIEVEDGFVSDPPFSIKVNSTGGGAYNEGYYFGAHVQNAWASKGAMYGRIALEGSNFAPQTVGVPKEVRGFAGFMEYAGPPATVEGNHDFASLNQTVQNQHQFDYLRISQGNPWAFYTRDDAKILGTIEVEGNIVPTDGTLEIPSLETLGDLELSSDSGGISAEDFEITDDISGQFYWIEEFIQPFFYTNGAYMTVTVSCNSTDHILLSCSGGFVNDDDVPLHSPYMGAQKSGPHSGEPNEHCKAHARKPAGTGSETEFRVQALCWNPNG